MNQQTKYDWTKNMRWRHLVTVSTKVSVSSKGIQKKVKQIGSIKGGIDFEVKTEREKKQLLKQLLKRGYLDGQAYKDALFVQRTDIWGLEQ